VRPVLEGPGLPGEHTHFYDASELEATLKAGGWTAGGVWSVVGGRWLLAVCGEGYARVRAEHERAIRAESSADFTLARAWEGSIHATD
jgi:hypothetical protein